MRAKRGFTLIELSIVFALIGALAAIGLHAFAGSRERAEATEALHNLATIVSLELAFPGGPIPCEPAPAAVPDIATAWVPSEGFERLGFSPGLTTRFQYSVSVPSSEGEPFVVRAESQDYAFEHRSDRREATEVP
ncbi:MAG: type II secretion system protein [Myxococcales bacterium]|nr:type II secretion system protein [Myxococcales bacterium]